jgi:hypothetical protein
VATRIGRHALPQPDAAWPQIATEAFTSGLDDLGRSPAAFGLTLSQATSLVQARATLDPDAAELDTWEAVVAAMQVGTAAFAAAQVDLREKGKVPQDIQRPPGANQGDLCSPSAGVFYGIKCAFRLASAQQRPGKVAAVQGRL